MMGCSDCSELMNRPANSIHGCKVRPLMPKPPPTNTSSVLPNPNSNPSSCTCPHNASHSTSNDPLEINKVPLVSSNSRWNPTPEQRRALEEIYRGGTRTPTADQIKQITFKLRRFGKIEGKNVFYWFQNHKARERQKRRRQQLDHFSSSGDRQHHHQLCQTKEPGFEAAQANINAASNCIVLSEESVSMFRSRTDRWIQLEERELQRGRRRSRRRRSTCTLPIDLMNTMTTLSSIAPEEALGAIDTNFPSMKFATNIEDESGKPQTLELFPLRSNDPSVEEMEIEVPLEYTSFNPSQFFEFLPLKN